MQTHYYILGSGGFAREVLFYAKNNLNDNHIFKGFIDNVNSSNKNNIIDESVFLSKIKPDGNVILFNGIGNPEILQKIHEKFINYNFPNLIHQNVIAEFSSLKIGFGNIITPSCILTVDIEIGNFNILNLNTTIGHDTKIGSYNVINPGSNISGNVCIGNANLLGTNCSVLQGVNIGNLNKIGATSMVNKNVSNGQTVVGIPAKPLIK
jgi:sugar O-acyltransferase (sialic acid O-acetyltransferase NeuD family)